MRRAPQVRLDPDEQRTLERWASGAPRRERRALRSRIVLEAARGSTNAEIAAELATHPETVARWRSRFVINGLEGVEREAPRRGGSPRVAPTEIGRILDATVAGDGMPEGGWTTRTLARSLHVNHMLVHRVWRAHGFAGGSPEASPAVGSVRIDVAGAIMTRQVRAVVFIVDNAAGPRPEDGESVSDRPDVTMADLVSGTNGPGRSVVSTVQRLEKVRRRDLGGTGPAAALLVFLRGLERRHPPTERLDVVLDRAPSRLDRRVLAWLDAHPRFRIFGTESGTSWSRAVGAWLNRWDARSEALGDLRSAASFATAFPLRGPREPKPLDRFSWYRPSSHT